MIPFVFLLRLISAENSNLSAVCIVYKPAWNSSFIHYLFFRSNDVCSTTSSDFWNVLTALALVHAVMRTASTLRIVYSNPQNSSFITKGNQETCHSGTLSVE